MSRFNDPWDYQKGKATWRRDQQEREQRELLETLRNQFRQTAPFHEPRRPEPSPSVRGDYLIYYLGGPLNATQEYFWDKILPKDQDIRDVLIRRPVFPLARTIRKPTN